MINFKPLRMNDREWIEEKLAESGYNGCDYVFGNLYIWREVTEISVALVHDMLCIKSSSYYNKKPIYTYPAGKGDTKRAVEEMLADARERGHEFYLRGIIKEEAEKLKAWFPEVFNIEEAREEWDYIYSVSDLAQLKGKKYHGKRNHMARFKDGAAWHYEPMSEENIPECIKMNEEWCIQYGCAGDSEILTEQCAVREAFRNFKELSLCGGVLYQNDRVVAFTIGEPLNSDTFIVHIEKAFPDIQGAYPMINQQFILHAMEGFLYVNREEDLGKEGLRKAKLSYYPKLLLEKYTAKRIEAL